MKETFAFREDRIQKCLLEIFTFILWKLLMALNSNNFKIEILQLSMSKLP